MVTRTSKIVSVISLLLISTAVSSQQAHGKQKEFYSTLLSYARSEAPKLFGQCALLTWVQKAQLIAIDKEIAELEAPEIRDGLALSQARDKRKMVALEHDKWLAGYGYGIERLLSVKKVPFRYGKGDHSVVQISKTDWIKLFNLLSENCMAKPAEGNTVEVISESGSINKVTLSTNGYSITQPFLPMDESENKVIKLSIYGQGAQFEASQKIYLGQRKTDPANVWRLLEGEYDEMPVSGCKYKHEVRL